MQGYNKDIYRDIQTPLKQLISKLSKPQFSSIQELDMDLSQVVTRDGKQMQTVGHHWLLSGPLTQEQRERMERVGVCVSCHQEIPDGTMPIKAIVKAADILGLTPFTDEEHSKLLNKDIRWAAFTRIIMPVTVLVLLVLVYIVVLQAKKIKAEQ